MEIIPVIGGEGYWDADVYEGACLGSCVDTVITSFHFIIYLL